MAKDQQKALLPEPAPHDSLVLARNSGAPLHKSSDVASFKSRRAPPTITVQNTSNSNLDDSGQDEDAEMFIRRTMDKPAAEEASTDVELNFDKNLKIVN